MFSFAVPNQDRPGKRTGRLPISGARHVPATCLAPGHSGTCAPERHSLCILSRRTDAATGRTLQSVVTYEEGRRLGPCPASGG